MIEQFIIDYFSNLLGYTLTKLKVLHSEDQEEDIWYFKTKVYYSLYTEYPLTISYNSIKSYDDALIDYQAYITSELGDRKVELIDNTSITYKPMSPTPIINNILGI